MKLTATNIRTLKITNGKDEQIYFDDEIVGLGLRVRKTGGRSLVFQYARRGPAGNRTPKLKIGTVGAIDFAEARKVAKNYYARVQLGQDPARDKTDARIKSAETFAAFLPRFLAHQRGRLRPRTYPDQERHLLVHAKALHDLQLAKITRRDIAAVLGTVAANAGKPTSNRVRASLSAFATWCMGEGVLDANFVVGTHKHDQRKRDRVLSPEELKLIWTHAGDDHYDTLVNRMLKDCHDWKLADLNDRTVRQLYDIWTGGGKKIAIGHSLIASLRRLANFGRATLEDSQCDRLSMVLHNMRFEAAGKRSEQLTAEQANAIRAQAHQQGQHSLALAQAFQFDLQLRQTDVIGEWVPLKEPGTSEVVAFDKKWLRGLRWSQIDNLFLRVSIKGPRRQQQDREFNLRGYPMVMEELRRFGDALPSSGPIIVNESTGRPWRTITYRLKWREVADACGIPKEIRNSDSRPRGASTRAIKTAGDLAPATRR